jgi:hypothetical protein
MFATTDTLKLVDNHLWVSLAEMDMGGTLKINLLKFV